MIGAGRVFAHSSGPLRAVVGGGLLSSGLQLADFVTVRADGCFPLRATVDEARIGDQGLKRLDTFRLDGGRQRGNAGSFLGFNPCLPQCPREALASDVGKLDLRGSNRFGGRWPRRGT